MSHWRFSRRFEVADKEQQRNSRERQPRDDAEAIHEREEAHLMLKLLIQVAVRGGGGIRARESFRDQIIR
jgi:hypothetical protein